MSWPKYVDVYLHANKEVISNVADRLGLQGKARDEFKWALHEVKVMLKVFANGEYEIEGVLG